MASERSRLQPPSEYSWMRAACKRPSLVEARGEACQERVPLAGDRHIQAPRKADPHRPAGLARAQRGHRGEAIGLRFLAAERAAHAQALHRHHVARHAQHTRDNLLRLAGMLRGGVQRDAARFVQPRQRRLRLQIKMLLAADVNFALDAMLDARQFRCGIAAPYGQRTAVKTLRRDRVFHGENGRAAAGTPRTTASAPSRAASSVSPNTHATG